jgi:hypothetical protein
MRRLLWLVPPIFALAAAVAVWNQTTMRVLIDCSTMADTCRFVGVDHDGLLTAATGLAVLAGGLLLVGLIERRRRVHAR